MSSNEIPIFILLWVYRCVYSGNLGNSFNIWWFCIILSLLISITKKNSAKDRKLKLLTSRGKKLVPFIVFLRELSVSLIPIKNSAHMTRVALYVFRILFTFRRFWSHLDNCEDDSTVLASKSFDKEMCCFHDIKAGTANIIAFFSAFSLDFEFSACSITRLYSSSFSMY